MNEMIRIKNAITHGDKNTDWFKLREELRDYLKSDSPEEEKNELKQYTEMLYMICSGIEYRNNKNEKHPE